MIVKPGMLLRAQLATWLFKEEFSRSAEIKVRRGSFGLVLATLGRGVGTDPETRQVYVWTAASMGFAAICLPSLTWELVSG